MVAPIVLFSAILELLRVISVGASLILFILRVNDFVPFLSPSNAPKVIVTSPYTFAFGVIITDILLSAILVILKLPSSRDTFELSFESTTSTKKASGV